MRIVLVLEYDGSRYCGWQSQLESCAIQDVVESALSAIAQEDVRVITAGRTDAGVHAFYQVIHFDTLVHRPVNAWVRGVNAFLPDDISILWAGEISDNFHARYSAIERRYLYLLLNQPVRPGLHHNKVGWFHQPLELEKMQAAGRFLIGEHDFSSFRAAECQANSPVRTMAHLNITRQGNLVIFDLRANSFCIIWSEILSVALFISEKESILPIGLTISSNTGTECLQHRLSPLRSVFGGC